MDEKTNTILCVDDEDRILRVLEMILSREGYKVFKALGGQEALAILEKEKVELIISDQRMPGMTGTELFRAVRQKYPGIVRIMMSGYSDFDSLVNAINEGEIFRFISKPWETEQLRELIRLAFAQNTVMKNMEELARSVSDIAKIAGKVSVNLAPDSRCLTMSIGNQSEIFPRNDVLSFLRVLFDTLGLKEHFSFFSGVVTREKGVVSLSLDIGKGMTLKVHLPNMEA
ncbi:MAG: hypothetical protein C0404_08455 [Verrucomicrobia bacterium]|nr:hypothetical protein [Verrucomicrobiota bacterium]